MNGVHGRDLQGGHTTPWSAGMVVMLKKSGEVRICVDLKPLNESVLRVVHPIPSVDETLGKLAWATVFTTKKRVLASSFIRRFQPVNHIYNTLREILLHFKSA